MPLFRGSLEGGPVNVVARRASKATAVVGVAILGVAILAGAVRVLPWVVAPEVPFGVAVPFARALFAVGLETTLLCAPPIGFALASSTLVERGEARAFFALGLGPLRVMRAGVGPALAFAAMAGIAALSWGNEAAAPGRLARSLVEQSKRSCSGAEAPRVAHVPFVGVTWLCFRDHAPRLSGDLPGGGGTFTAADLAVSDDLRAVHFSDMHLLLGKDARVALRVNEAHVSGLSPWGRASNLRPWLRAVLLSSTGATLALLASFFVLAGSVAHRFSSLVLGGVGPVTALLVMARLEQQDHRPLDYLWVPAAGVVALVAFSLVPRAVRHWRATQRSPGARP
ncbi:MAG TPA: hypothetical protein VJT73_21320 [Polyangiaceae bacterium]|nr:hypothetical protein [Polyangiaceae bacterium]